MAVSNTTPRIYYTGNNSSTDYSFSFEILKTTDIEVYVDGTKQTLGTKATATSTIGGGAVTGLTLGVGGTNYTVAPTITISGGGGSGATATCTISNGAVNSFTVTGGGSNYTSSPTVTFSGGGTAYEINDTTDNTASTGTVQFRTAPASSTKIAIVSNRTPERTTDFTDGAALSAATLNREFDNLNAASRDNKSVREQSIKIDVSDADSFHANGDANYDLTLPNKTTRASKYLGFDSDGNVTALGIVASINDLSDVNTSGVATDNILKWNGSNWVPTSTLDITTELVDDTSPQLGGDLDVNGNTITAASGNIKFDKNIEGHTTGGLILSQLAAGGYTSASGADLAYLYGPGVHIEAAAQYDYPSITLKSRSSDAYGNIWSMRSRDNSGSDTYVNNNDLLFQFYSSAYDGSSGSTNGYATKHASVELKANENHTASAQGAKMEFYTTTTGTKIPLERLRIDDKVWVNPGTNDVDFRVDGNTNDFLLVADAGLERVGIGTNTPTTKLDVAGTVNATAFTGDGSGLTIAINNLSDVDTSGVANNKILKYNSTTSKFEIGDDTGHTTTDTLTEGSSNLYYTDARVLTKINATDISALQNVHDATPTDGQGLVWSNANSRWQPGSVSSELVGDTTPELAGNLDANGYNITAGGSIVLGSTESSGMGGGWGLTPVLTASTGRPLYIENFEHIYDAYCNEAISAGDIVSTIASITTNKNPQVWLAKASVQNRVAMGIALTGGAQGDTIKIQTAGMVDLTKISGVTNITDLWESGLTSNTSNEEVYLSATTGGKLTNVCPTSKDTISGQDFWHYRQRIGRTGGSAPGNMLHLHIDTRLPWWDGGGGRDEDTLDANWLGLGTDGFLSMAYNWYQKQDITKLDLPSTSSELTSGLTDTDELIINDDGTLKRMDVSVIKSHILTTPTIAHINGTAGITLDAATNLVLDAGSGTTFLKDDGAEYGRLVNNSGQLWIYSGDTAGGSGGNPIKFTNGDTEFTGDVTFSGSTNFVGGQTFTANIDLNPGKGIKFEGATANANETFLTVVDPTADRTITLPDTTGTVALTSDIANFITASSSETLTNKIISGARIEGSSSLLSPIIHGTTSGSNGVLRWNGADEGPDHTITMQVPTAGISSDYTLELPRAPGDTGTDTIVSRNSTDTLTNKTLTTPKFADAGYIADANGNEQIVFQTTASAVNQLEVTNAATGNSPTLAATGDDTNIHLLLNSKGTGEVKVNSDLRITKTGGKLYADDATFDTLRIETQPTLDVPLSVANGGTGATTFADNKLIVGDTTSNLQSKTELEFDGTTFKVIDKEIATSKIKISEGNTTTIKTSVANDHLIIKPDQTGATGNYGAQGEWGWGGGVTHINGPLSINPTDTPDVGELYNQGIQITGTHDSWPAMVLASKSDSGKFGNVWFLRSAGDGTDARCSDGDTLGGFYASGYAASGSGANYNTVSAACYFLTAGDHSDTNSGGYFQVKGTAEDSTSQRTVANFKGNRLHINPDNQNIDFRVDGDSNDNLLFVDAGNERVGIGTSSELHSGGEKLAVSGGSSTQPVLTLGVTHTSVMGGVKFRNGNGEIGSVTYNASGVAYNTSSDYRLKENVVDMTDATTRLKQLQPKRFNFKVDADTTVDGFLAHEVSSVVPEAVSGVKDAVDSNGDVVPQQIDQSKLVPLLVKTIQELEARIKTLEDNQ